MMDIQQVNSAAVKAAGIYAGNRSVQRSTQPAVEQKPERVEAPTGKQLTSAEREYFAEAFPSAANDVRQHVVYERNGVRPPVSLGTMVDRKG
jgi:hypothetical protein